MPHQVASPLRRSRYGPQQAHSVGEAVDVVALVTLHTGMAGFTHTGVLTPQVVLTALGPMGARRRDLVWLTRHIMQSHAQ